MSEQEKVDLEILKNELVKLKVSSFDYIKYCLTMTQEDLIHSGNKTIEQAIIFGMNSKIKDIKILTKEFIKKYPDSK